MSNVEPPTPLEIAQEAARLQRSAVVDGLGWQALYITALLALVFFALADRTFGLIVLGLGLAVRTLFFLTVARQRRKAADVQARMMAAVAQQFGGDTE